MSYIPGPLPKETPPYMVRELHAISEGVEQPRTVVAFAPTAVEPSKPRDGMMVKAVAPWDPGYGFGPYIYDSAQGWIPMFGAAVPDGILVACSDETTALTTGTKRTFYLPYDVQIDSVVSNVVTAPIGAALIVDVKISGVSILSTKPQIAAGGTSSLNGTQAVIATAAHAKGSKVELVIDQIGSGTAGAGLKVYIEWRRTT